MQVSGLQDAAAIASASLSLLAIKGAVWINGNTEAGLFWQEPLVAFPGRLPLPLAPASGLSLGSHGVFTLSRLAPAGLTLCSPFPLLLWTALASWQAASQLLARPSPSHMSRARPGSCVVSLLSHASQTLSLSRGCTSFFPFCLGKSCIGT